MEKDIDFTKYNLDRDIPDREWNMYIRKKYEKDYRVITKEDGTTAIKCKFGAIEPYSLIKGKLLFCGEFPTNSKKTYFLKNQPTFVGIKENYDFGCVLVFPEKELKKLEKAMQIKGRNKLSEETRQKLRDNLNKIRMRGK